MLACGLSLHLRLIVGAPAQLQDISDRFARVPSARSVVDTSNQQTAGGKGSHTGFLSLSMNKLAERPAREISGTPDEGAAMDESTEP